LHLIYKLMQFTKNKRTTKLKSLVVLFLNQQNMKKTITLLFISLASFVFSQNMQVQNMANYLRNKDFQKAKESADAAAVHESTKNNSKMWMYRGNVYKAIYSDTSKKVRDIDPMAEEKALDAYINCFKNDKDKLYSDNSNDDNIKGSIVSAAAATKRKAGFYSYNKEYEKALYCYDLLEQALPYDFDQGMKRQNITKEKIIFEKFEMYKSAANKEKTKEYAGKLMDMKYKDPKIYTDMIKLSLLDKDTASALSYIEKGKLMFEDNMSLVGTEIDIYMARKKTDVLTGKLKSAIELAPDNEVLHIVLADVYRKTGKFEEAEKEYQKALELKPDSEPANYNLGVLYYSAAKDWNDKLNALPMKDPKTKEYEAKSNEYFKKSVGYFESSYEVTKDANTKKILRQITLRLGDTEKAEKYK
jgi:tetratricopeptide (TPR) repeat protein